MTRINYDLPADLHAAAKARAAERGETLGKFVEACLRAHVDTILSVIVVGLDDISAPDLAEQYFDENALEKQAVRTGPVTVERFDEWYLTNGTPVGDLEGIHSLRLSAPSRMTLD
jgi:hypothetical protein